MTMEAMRTMLETILGMSVLRAGLSLLIRDGTTKRCAQYAFSLIQMLVMLRLLKQIAAMWIGGWK